LYYWQKVDNAYYENIKKEIIAIVSIPYFSILVGGMIEIQKNASVGARCKISSHSFICEGVAIEDEVFIGHGVMFTNDLYPRAVGDHGELQTEAEMVRNLIYKTAWQMDRMSKPDVAPKISDKVAMCNYRANRLVCEAADRAMQIHGGIGYSRHKPFEHIYRHHRRYRITEGTEEIQMRRVAQIMFSFGRRARSEG